ncbi:MAG: hypothetical protein ACFB2X_17260 [Rivularia sp. (in: cyanobacteria)]
MHNQAAKSVEKFYAKNLQTFSDNTSEWLTGTLDLFIQRNFGKRGRNYFYILLFILVIIYTHKYIGYYRVTVL